MASWFDIRTKLEEVTHTAFLEPATFTPPAGASFEVTGVLTQDAELSTVRDEVGHEGNQDAYEVRKAGKTPAWTVDDFTPEGQMHGRLELASGQVFALVGIRQTDTLIWLHLAPEE